MSSSSDIVCKLCDRQIAKYTCPACNVPYCSLVCYRSPAHGECSEGFYRKEISTVGGASAQAEERLKMMEMLKRLEQEQDLDGQDDGEDVQDLTSRFTDVDLDDTDALWERLTPAERARFLAAPFSALSVVPWWENQGNDHLAPLPHIPNTLAPRPTIGITYNLLAIILVYTYACRHLAVASLDCHAEAPGLVRHLLPFLAESQSTFAFSTMEDVIVSLASREVPVVSLLNDAVTLLRPSVISEAGSHPHDRALRALGDLATVFGNKPKAQRKVIWYAACVRGFVGKQSMLGRVVREAEDRLRIENVAEKGQDSQATSISANSKQSDRWYC